MTTLPRDEFQIVEKEVFAKLKAGDPLDYILLEANKEVLQKVEKAIRKTYDDMKHMLSNADSLENALAHLPPERQDLIKTTFRLQSFKAEIQRQSDGTVELLFESLEGKPLSFIPSVVKVTESNYEEIDIILAARIIFEVIVMLINIVGFVVTPSDRAVADALKFLCTFLSSRSNAFADVEKVVEAVRKGEGWAAAKGVCALLLDLFVPVGTPVLHLGALILEDASWTDMIITVARLLCALATTTLTGGAATLAQVISFLLYGTSFYNKITHLIEYRDIWKPQQKVIEK